MVDAQRVPPTPHHTTNHRPHTREPMYDNPAADDAASRIDHHAPGQRLGPESVLERVRVGDKIEWASTRTDRTTSPSIIERVSLTEDADGTRTRSVRVTGPGGGVYDLDVEYGVGAAEPRVYYIPPPDSDEPDRKPTGALEYTAIVAGTHPEQRASVLGE